ncbi:MAG: tetratricopeptide repeat protein [Arenicella sp.]|nr:tetratricopeptide repeat protein [Arenicella sp.]
MSDYNNESLENLASMSIRALRASKHDEAIEITQEMISRRDDHAGAHAVQFSSLFKSEKFEQARRMGGRAAKLNPESVFILNNQACLQLEAKQPAAAAGLLKSLIDQFGEQGQWLYNLALAQRMVGNFEYAINTFRRTLDYQPEHDRAAFQLADCLKIVGQHEEAVRAYDYVRLLRSKHAPTHSNYIHNAVANNGLSATDLDHELSLWRERFIPNDKRYTVDQPSSALSINIGFLIGVIPDLWLRSMVVPVINELANSKDSISVYWHDEKPPINLFDEQVSVVLSANLSDANFARQVRADGIDIMIDICGMRLGSRQRALGLHLAGRQYGWLAHEGYYATPLVVALDQKMDAQRFYIESHNETTQAAAKKTLIGIASQRGLAYEVIKTWSYILQQLPDWKLLLDAQENHIIKALRQRFSSMGVDSNRLIFDKKLGAAKGSVVLDNFIQNDPVTASYALHSGGILVALSGPLFPAQQSAALLSQVDRDDWLCASTSEYVARAIALADGALAEPLNQEQFDLSRLNNLQTFATHFRNTISS